MAFACAAWLAALASHRVPPPRAAILVPVAAYVLFSVLSAALSADPQRSFKELGDLLTLGLLPITISLLDPRRWDRLLQLLTLVVTASAIAGLIQYARGASVLENRLDGLANHYTTFSGWTLVVCLLLLGDMMTSTDRRRLWWTAPAFALGTIAMILNLTRGVWIGFTVAAILVAGITRPRMLFLLPLAAIVFALVMPRTVVERASSVFDLNQPGVQERKVMFETGIRMVRDNPVFGLGPGMVQPAFSDYKSQGPPSRVPHLHNNVVQIAAERGIAGLAAYLTILALFLIQVWRVLRSPDQSSRSAIVGSLLAVVGVTVAGGFEYNWGDAEIWIVTLVCLAAPFALGPRLEGQ